jgi:hypothetical protein
MPATETQGATDMDSPNRYVVQALFKDNLEYFAVDVPANDPIEAEAIVRHRSPRELLIASVIRAPRAA